MQICPIQQTQNTPQSFGAVMFKTKSAKQKFLNTLKQQTLTDFNESMNIIKSQADNYENICIKQHSKKNQRPNTLNLYAEINSEVVEADNSLPKFLKTCAQKADACKIRLYELYIKDGTENDTTIKKRIYKNAFQNDTFSFRNILLSPDDL